MFFFRWLHAWIQANSSLSTFQSYANELRIPPSPWIEITNAIGRMTFSAKLEPTNSCKIELKKLADLEQKWFQDQSSMCSGARAHTEKKKGKGFASYIYTHTYIYISQIPVYGLSYPSRSVLMSQDTNRHPGAHSWKFNSKPSSHSRQMCSTVHFSSDGDRELHISAFTLAHLQRSRKSVLLLKLGFPSVTAITG